MFQYNADAEKVANLLQVPLYFDQEIYTTSRQEEVGATCLFDYHALCRVHVHLHVAQLLLVHDCTTCAS